MFNYQPLFGVLFPGSKFQVTMKKHKYFASARSGEM